MSKFSAEIPKGDGWGVEATVAEMVKKIQRGEKSPLVPVVGVIDVKEIKIDPETHNVVAVVRIRRLEALDTIERIRVAQKMILEQAAARRGEGTTLPFEEAQLIEMAFGGLDVKQIEQDETEAKEDEGLTDMDRLRRHMVAVHKADPDGLVKDGSDADVRAEHDRDHAAEPDEGVPPHDAEWWAWRRVDIEAAEAESDEAEDEEPAADTPIEPFNPDEN